MFLDMLTTSIPVKKNDTCTCEISRQTDQCGHTQERRPAGNEKLLQLFFFRLYIYCSVNAHGLSWLVAGQSNDRDEALRFQFTPRCQLLYASAGYAASLLQLQGCTVRALLDCAFVSFHTGR